MSILLWSRFNRATRKLYQRARLYTATARTLPDGWEAVIGIEVHAQINSKTKLFSDTPTSFNDQVNTKVSIIDAAYPGVQPRLNKHCVELAVKTALALNGSVQRRSTFDRKHYFYPDLPQGYQITQQREPIARGGRIRLTELDGLDKPIEVGIHQLQLEQDTGKSFHDMRPGHTLLDFNRAGIGLMEIVTKPDMRVLDAEIRRQISIIEQGGIIEAETRGYDVAADKTFKLRGKESAPDYRYMPEPDLAPLLLSSDYINNLAGALPELPDACRDRIMNQYKLSVTDANVVLNEPGSLQFFENVCIGRNPRLVVNW
ncbi:hypothetical protein EC973_002237 [Apophysomyces ossiformis]|uniref:Aspartyl/Glutamyl-tRNA(Gln) amidotransferase subunit B/E catalytic domain-containing protein n=1 Tax=Apophysomyces ossiformis TaxID=679940 RepID=A0A8H7BUB6_9FUNG|nr:hypothetical protein EC973_002237 [Apophysomyces ossiformis]